MAELMVIGWKVDWSDGDLE